MNIRRLSERMTGLALCEEDPEAFFPVGADDPNLPPWAREALSADPTEEIYLREEKARTLCAACPVRIECLALADLYDDAPAFSVQGIWGGLSLAERRARKRRMNREARRREIAASIPSIMLRR